MNKAASSCRQLLLRSMPGSNETFESMPSKGFSLVIRRCSPFLTSPLASAHPVSDPPPIFGRLRRSWRLLPVRTLRLKGDRRSAISFHKVQPLVACCSPLLFFCRSTMLRRSRQWASRLCLSVGDKTGFQRILAEPSGFLTDRPMTSPPVHRGAGFALPLRSVGCEGTSTETVGEGFAHWRGLLSRTSETLETLS